MSDPLHADPSLFARFRAGDPEAFRSLVERHRPALEVCVHRRLHPRIGKRISVADIVQEAEFAAFERCADFHGDAHEDLRKWLVAIAVNRARKANARHVGAERRAVGHEVTNSSRTAPSVLAGRDGTPSQALAAKELAALADRARVVLTKEDEQLLRIVHDEGLTLQDAAERLGRSLPAVKKQHVRALRRLGRAFRRLRGGNDDAL